MNLNRYRKITSLSERREVKEVNKVKLSSEGFCFSEVVYGQFCFVQSNACLACCTHFAWLGLSRLLPNGCKPIHRIYQLQTALGQLLQGCFFRVAAHGCNWRVTCRRFGDFRLENYCFVSDGMCWFRVGGLNPVIGHLADRVGWVSECSATNKKTPIHKNQQTAEDSVEREKDKL